MGPVEGGCGHRPSVPIGRIPKDHTSGVCIVHSPVRSYCCIGYRPVVPGLRGVYPGEPSAISRFQIGTLGIQGGVLGHGPQEGIRGVIDGLHLIVRRPIIRVPTS